MAAAAPAAALSIPRRPAVAAGRLPRGVLPHWPRRGRRSALFAPAALRADPAHQPVLFAGAAQHDQRLPAARRAALAAAGGIRYLASAVARAIPGDALPAARLYPLVAGRSRGNGTRGRGALPVPRPPGGRARRGAATGYEGARAAGKICTAPGARAGAAARDRRATQATLPRPRQRKLRAPGRAGLCRRAA